MAKPREIELEIADWALHFFEGGYRFGIFKHGRAAGCTVNLSNCYIKICKENPNTVVIVLRNYRTDASDSILMTMRDILIKHGIEHNAPISRQTIFFPNGSTISCYGVEYKIEKLKGLLDRADHVMLEECQDLTEDQFLLIEPTVRKPNSTIVLSWNPQDPEEYASRMFNEPVLTYPFKTMRAHLTWRNNPWLPDEVKKQIERANLPGQERLKAVYEGTYDSSGDLYDISKLQEVDDIGLEYWLDPEIQHEVSRIRCWDISYYAKQTTDNTVGLLLARRNEYYLIEDVFINKISAGEIEQMVLAHAARDQCRFGIETVAANQTYVDGIINKAAASGSAGIELKPMQRSKVERAALSATLVSRGLVSVPKDARWLSTLKSQLYNFPKQGHADDIVDAFAYGAEDLARGYSGELRVYGAMKPEELSEEEKYAQVSSMSWFDFPLGTV